MIVVKKVLIIEDNEDNMELCLLLLHGKYDLVSSHNGTDGIEKAHNEIPDLILLDLSLPDMNGKDVAKKIKNNEKIKHIPIIALTAHGLDSDKRDALNAGCDYYIEKPFEIRHLLEVIKSYV